MDRGTVCLVTMDDSLAPPSITSSNPHEWPVDRVFSSAQPRGNHVLKEDGETSLAREAADFAVPLWPLVLTIELMGSLALYLIIYHTFQLLFPVFAFLSCKPVLHFCPGAWSYSWLFWNAHCLPTANPTEPSRALRVSSPSLFHFSVFMLIANSVCSGITFFSSHESNYKMAWAAI